MDVEEAVRKGLEQLFRELLGNFEKLNLSKELNTEIIEYLYSKKEKVLDLLKRRQRIFEIGRGVYRLNFISSLALARRVETYAVVKDLTGREKVVKIGRVPVEQAAWSTVIGMNALKCNCPDSLFNSWRSLRGLSRVSPALSKQLGISGLFDKFNLCKHTLYALSLSIGIHGLKPYQKHIEILKLEVIGVILHRLKGKDISGKDGEIIREYMKKLLTAEE